MQSRTPAGSLQRYRIADRGPVLIEGRAIVQKIGAGAVRVLQSVDSMHEFVPGEVLVADMGADARDSGEDHDERRHP